MNIKKDLQDIKNRVLYKYRNQMNTDDIVVTVNTEFVYEFRKYIENLEINLDIETFPVIRFDHVISGINARPTDDTDEFVYYEGTFNGSRDISEQEFMEKFDLIDIRNKIKRINEIN